MKFKFNPKHNSIAAYVIIVFAVCLLLVALVFKYTTFINYAGKFFSIISPVIWGIGIAYILNPFMMFCERHYKKWFCKKKNRSSLTRSLAITTSLIVFLGATIALIVAIIPEIKITISNFFQTLPAYLDNLQKYITDILNQIIEWRPELADVIIIEDIEFNNIHKLVLNAAHKLEPKFNDMFTDSSVISTITTSAWSFIVAFKDFILGFVISIYFLYNKETYLAQITKLIHVIFSERKRNIILRIASRANETFLHYFTGMALDSLAIGFISFITLNIMGIGDYAILISIILGVTNMIPVFGPIVGSVPSALLIFLTSPQKTIIFIIFIIVLQQIDGNIIAPKIIGNSLGLSPFWIIFSILLGGGLFGFTGIIIFVPSFAVIYSLVKELVEDELEKKNLPVSTDKYRRERSEPIIQLSNFKFTKPRIPRKKIFRRESKKEKEVKKENDINENNTTEKE